MPTKIIINSEIRIFSLDQHILIFFFNNKQLTQMMLKRLVRVSSPWYKNAGHPYVTIGKAKRYDIPKNTK
jgi:hypothetical protein